MTRSGQESNSRVTSKDHTNLLLDAADIQLPISTSKRTDLLEDRDHIGGGMAKGGKGEGFKLILLLLAHGREKRRQREFLRNKHILSSDKC